MRLWAAISLPDLRTRSYPSWIAGLRYTGPDGTNRGKYCKGLRPGTVLSLVREPDNPHSESGLAVAVKHSGRHLGYIPNRHHWVGSAMDEGKVVDCVVDRINTTGWFFVRARFVGLTLTVANPSRERAASVIKEPKPKRNKVAEAREKERERKASDLCIDGLRVLAHIARSDDDLSAEELAVQAEYIFLRLHSAGYERDAFLIEKLLGTAQGLIVPRRAFVRAANIVAKDKDNFAQVLNATLRMVSRSGPFNEIERAALEKLQAAGSTNGWL